MHMMRTAALSAVMTLGLAGAASATEFLFSYSSNDGRQGAFGTFTATANGDGTFTATGGTITAFGPVVFGSGTLEPDGLAPTPAFSPSGEFTYDDQLLPGQTPLLTLYGPLFSIDGGELNIWSNGPGQGNYEFAFYNGGLRYDLGNFTLTEVPEPASWAMMLLGFGLVGSALRASRKSITA